MNEIVIESLAQFTDFVETTLTDQSDVLFRGQGGDWPLLPSLVRQRPTHGDLLATEQSMLAEFQRHSVPHLHATPQTTWDWLALAQHHGLPTRLIDWSLNPLASLWFAVHRPTQGSGDGILWVLRPDPDDFADDTDKTVLQCTRHCVFAPRHLTHRITAQVGWFTVHKAWTEEPMFEPLDKSTVLAPKLTRIVIPRRKFAHLRFYLDRYGINNASVFPDLDGLCAHLRWKYFYLPDEEPTA
jgi:hypothetical protein